VKLKIFGDNGESQLKSITEYGFEDGSSVRKRFKSIDVGTINRILIKVEGTQKYQCSKIMIFSGPKMYTFQCLRQVDFCTPVDTDINKCSLEMQADGPILYEITTKTCDEKNSGTTRPALFNLIGSKGHSQQKILSEFGFKAGSTIYTKIGINDIGDISGFKIQLVGGPGKWNPCSVTVKNLATEKQNVYKLSNIQLVNPGKDTYILDTKQSNKDDEDEKEESDKSFDVHNPDGGVLDYSEYKSNIDLRKT
jgi:hypothetical protein